MRFHGQVTRKSRNKKRKLLPLLIPAFIIAIFLFIYFVNARLAPIYVQYAEVQTQKIASHVINKAISSRTANVLNIEDIIVNVPSDSKGMIKFNTEIINRASSEIHALVESHLQQAEAGNLDILPTDEIEFDPQAMESEEGIVFFVPLAQAANIPLLGNLGPKIPIRFHVIGQVQATMDTKISEFGINNAVVEVNILLTVNVQIIAPLATKQSVVTQKIPVAMGLIQSTVPQIYTTGGGNPPSVEVPAPTQPKE
ncbi:sporulation protein YunB [Sporosarcina sp. ANT_H38]|uniref:sporulation protein YunB n=1 Tax=Sporosarcina sp. ANT_H38 TaxID=2597358 RepID=UPI0011F0A089|nr:sporulation protein YunB [Sporosarcina sp. ANT_H38]KAA0944133.1 sporulation protein YunB [Sporosarcina sp. ANT_H38]